MENASKALIIAGAILISILLIGVGMLLYNSATGTMDEAVSQMSRNEKTMFNSQFTQYEGSISGSNVKALLQIVGENNAEHPAAGEPKHVALTGDSTVASAIISAKKYTVTCTISNTTGLVSSIEINK